MIDMLSIDKAIECERNHRLLPEYHEQLAEWLEELKAIKEKGRYVQGNKAGQKIGYRNAIDDFASLMKEAMEHDWSTTKICDQIIYSNLYDKCNEIAEQLKEGGKYE